MSIGLPTSIFAAAAAAAGSSGTAAAHAILSLVAGPSAPFCPSTHAPCALQNSFPWRTRNAETFACRPVSPLFANFPSVGQCSTSQRPRSTLDASVCGNAVPAATRSDPAAATPSGSHASSASSMRITREGAVSVRRSGWLRRTAPTRRRTSGSRANHPTVSKLADMGWTRAEDTAPWVGRKPKTALCAAGTRTEPPVSVPAAVPGAAIRRCRHAVHACVRSEREGRRSSLIQRTNGEVNKASGNGDGGAAGGAPREEVRLYDVLSKEMGQGGGGVSGRRNRRARACHAK